MHEERVDLWNGMASSPVAVTLRDRRNYVDLTDAARLRWIVRTNAIHLLHPVVKLADGRLIVGDRGITTHGEFLSLEVAFSGMRWYALDPVKVIVLTEVLNADLRRWTKWAWQCSPPGAGTASPGRRTCPPWSCSPIRCRDRSSRSENFRLVEKSADL